MNQEEIKSVVQDKFLNIEKVLAILYNCKVTCPNLEHSMRILALVQRREEKAVFCMLSKNYPPNSFSDLSFERIIPVDEDFKCEIDNKQRNDVNQLFLIFTSSKMRLKFEISDQFTINSFVDELFRGIEAIDNCYSAQSFEWLKKYTEKLQSQTIETSPMLLQRQSEAPDGPLAVRESRIKYEMFRKQDEYTSKKPYTVFAATWNVNNKSPTISLSGWLSVEVEAPHIYAIGFQELDLSFIFDSTTREEEWCDAVSAGIDRRVKYVLVEKVRLVGMMLLILVKESHFPYVRNVACDTVGTGIMGKMGNKGAVSIRFDLHNTSMCFVNSHLAAHSEEFERRNQDYRDICSRTQFHIDNHPPKSIEDHDQIFWIGDLNYRITDIDAQVLKLLLNKGKFEDILESDQLFKQRQIDSVFVGYREGLINFRPTYKYDPGTDNWDSSEKNRAPAWCDRILWRGEDIEQLAYRSHPSLNISDHKPVSATFKSHIRVIIEEKYRKVYEEVIKKLDKLENELIPQVMVDRTELDFDTVNYLEPQFRSMTIANTGQVPVQFEFIRKLEETSFCKEWLLVEPYAGCIMPGEKCDIQMKIFINKNSACKLNTGTDKLYNILVLHLEGGKDIFITVTGKYQHSSFGCSIEALVLLKVPIREISAEALADIESKRDQSVTNQTIYPIPKEIWLLVDHIYRHGMKEHNLFDHQGHHSEIVKIRDWLDEGSVDPLPGSIHSVAQALLLLLESTAEPIIPYNLQAVCVSASANYLQCKQIIMQLPEFRRNVFLYLCEFLQEVLTHSADNGLNAQILSSLFATILLRDTPNQSQSQDRQRGTRPAVDKKKANFVYHFLVNPQSELIFGPSLA